MKILVVGAGAVGGYFGGRLAQAGRDVTLLVRERRAAQLRDGLHLVSPHGNATISPSLITAEELRGRPDSSDIVIVSTKSYSLASAMQDLAPAVGPATAVIPLLNGMRHLNVLRERFGPERVFGGSVRIIADVLDDGTVEQQTPLGELSFGRLPEQGDAPPFDLDAMRRTLTAPGMVTLLQPDVLATMWQKWWILASMNAICILAGGSLGDAVAQPYGEVFARRVLRECISLAEENGYPANASALDEHLARLTDRISPLTTSMFRDMQRGLPVEADQIFGDLLARARGIAVPLLQAAYVRLKVYEAKRVEAPPIGHPVDRTQ